MTPSKPDYWTGTIDARVSPLTREQVRTRDERIVEIARKRKMFRLPDLYTVNKIADPKTLTGVPMRVSFVCPVISSTKARDKLCVIAPNGMEAWVDWK